MQLFVTMCRERGRFPRDFFRSLLDWSESLIEASRFSDALVCCDTALDLGARAFPDVWPWVRLRRAQVLVLQGELEEAHSTLMDTYRRLDLISDRGAIPALLDALGRVSLETRRATEFKRLLFDGLRLFHSRIDERRTAVRLARRAHRGTLRLLANREARLSDKLLFLLHWVCLGAATRTRWRGLSRTLERVVLGTVFVLQHGPRQAVRLTRVPGRSPRSDAVLVTRAMGGLGDLLMMTPGLRALRASHKGTPIVLAVPRRFFPIFGENDDVRLVDIEGDLDPAAYREWYNLTDCPAAWVESRTAPRVRSNRIEIFARGLGINGRRLRRMDPRPSYVVTEAERAWRDRYFADHDLTGRAVVGVQLRTDEAYRDVPHVLLIVEALADHARVLLFGGGLEPGFGHPRVIQVDGLDLRRAFALASRCDVLVAPDSAFVHLAGALDLPSVGLFGPTDGTVRAGDYPNCRVLDARRTLPCVPCWRNESTPCALTGLRPSACLGAIEPDSVVDAVRERLAAGRVPRSAGLQTCV